MGSGRGKTRRVQSSAGLAAQAIPHLLFDKGEWDEFVDGHDLVFVNLYEYYLGRPGNHIDSSETKKVMDELFADAVAVGAIVLPDDYGVDDFEFRMLGRGRIEISMKNEPALGTALVTLTHQAFPHKDRYMSDTWRALQAMHDLANRLFLSTGGPYSSEGIA